MNAEKSLETAILQYFIFLKNQKGLDIETSKSTILFKANELVFNLKVNEMIKYNEFGSCSKCGQCNMTTDGRYDVTLYHSISNTKLICNKCCGLSK